MPLFSGNAPSAVEVSFACFDSREGFCRGGQIRTADLTDPNRARYQTALRPASGPGGPEGRANMNGGALHVKRA